MILCDEIEPAAREAEIVLPFLGFIEARRAVCAFQNCLVAVDRKLIERLCVIETLRRIVRIIVLEIAVVDRETGRRLRDNIGRRLFRRCEECRTAHRVDLRRLPVFVILRAVADLMAECDHLAVLAAERAFHEIVAEMPQDRFRMLRLADLLIGLAEFVIAP